ncbi:No apical meristem (NAM) protein [Corchorus capsularis]|uniref:No apical meristem (NAM) protein n=1 Tax=Corchorus capsularis TaxID=210143 RepID=A0A1R3GYR4_COCAP|nr:No apical meristem (NAM) protein [Corchorus capsularis]
MAAAAADNTDHDVLMLSLITENNIGESKRHGNRLLLGLLDKYRTFEDLGNLKKIFLTSREEWFSRKPGKQCCLLPYQFWMVCEDLPQPVLNSNGDAIGFKRTLEFFDGYPTNADSTKIKWCIQEYSTAEDGEDDWLLCQISTAEPEGMNPVPEAELHSIPYIRTKPMENAGMHFFPSDQVLVLDYLACKKTPSQVRKPYVKVIPEAALVTEMCHPHHAFPRVCCV